MILKDNERICYRCGDRVKNQTDPKKHIQDTHQDIVCKQFLENNCTFGTKCMFPHKTTPVKNVEKPNTRHEAPHTQTQGDFQSVPTAGQTSLTVGEMSQDEGLRGEVKTWDK